MPSRLTAEPIIEAIIEIRLQASAPLSDVLPGLLLPFLGEHAATIERLPPAGIPKQIRDSDPNFAFQPLVRVSLDEGYRLLIGDASVVLVCPEDYPGGEAVKGKAVEIAGRILDAPVVNGVTRFSMKYADFIAADSVDEVAKFLKVEASFGDKSISDLSGLNIQFSVQENSITHLVRIVAPADVQRKNKANSRGVVVEIDTINQLDSQDAANFKSAFPQLLGELHLSHKKKFFSLLTDYALDTLGAVYD